jgi:uncharacterized protein (DUF486 family)
MLRSIGLLLASNVFMNIAWYGHLKFKESPLWVAILASWGIAFFEYCLQVPANRIGAETLTPSQLKVIQEALSMGTFLVIAAIMLKEPIRWNTVVGFLVVLLGVAIIFMGNKTT